MYLKFSVKNFTFNRASQRLKGKKICCKTGALSFRYCKSCYFGAHFFFMNEKDTHFCKIFLSLLSPKLLHTSYVGDPWCSPVHSLCHLTVTCIPSTQKIHTLEITTKYTKKIYRDMPRLAVM